MAAILWNGKGLAAGLLQLPPSPLCHTWPALLIGHTCCLSVISTAIWAADCERLFAGSSHQFILSGPALLLSDLDRLLDFWKPACTPAFGIITRGYISICMLLGPTLSPNSIVSASTSPHLLHPPWSSGPHTPSCLEAPLWCLNSRVPLNPTDSSSMPSSTFLVGLFFTCDTERLGKSLSFLSALNMIVSNGVAVGLFLFSGQPCWNTGKTWESVNVFREEETNTSRSRHQRTRKWARGLAAASNSQKSKWFSFSINPSLFLQSICRRGGRKGQTVIAQKTHTYRRMRTNINAEETIVKNDGHGGVI